MKILVTTDLSANSKSGLRFAIQLATQHKIDLTFFHSYYVMRPATWDDKTYSLFAKKEEVKIKNKLESFVKDVYSKMNLKPGKLKCVISHSMLPDSNIREFAEANKFNYICLGTRGAGTVRKIFGTNASNLIRFSSVPVIVVPSGYRPAKVNNILYASDLSNLENELKKVVAFAKPLKSKVELLHFVYPSEVVDAQGTLLNKAVKKFSKHDIKLHLENINLEKNLITNIEGAIRKSKSSMLIMFTQQNRTFFERMFLPSNAYNYAFNVKVPFLVFNKM